MLHRTITSYEEEVKDGDVNQEEWESKQNTQDKCWRSGRKSRHKDRMSTVHPDAGVLLHTTASHLTAL